MGQANWQRNARALAAGSVLINSGWNASFAFLPLIAEAPTTNEPSAFDMRATMAGLVPMAQAFELRASVV